MSKEHMLKDAWNSSLCDRLSWRGHLSRAHGLENCNFSSPGSSNQRQFRRATEFFGSDFYTACRDKFQKIVVLWGITSTARNELWSTENHRWHNFFYSDEKDHFSRFMTKHVYDHAVEIHQIRNQMMLWDRFFHAQGIKNFWFDTFNTHDYTRPRNQSRPYEHVDPAHYDLMAENGWPTYDSLTSGDTHAVPDKIMAQIERIFGSRLLQSLPDIDNLIDNHIAPRDLLSWLLHSQQIDVLGSAEIYHQGDWQIEHESMQRLVEAGMLNPHTFHPTQAAHEILSGFFADRLKEVLH